MNEERKRESGRLTTEEEWEWGIWLGDYNDLFLGDRGKSSQLDDEIDLHQHI